MSEELRTEIASYLKRTNSAPSALSNAANGDSAACREILRGRNPKPHTVKRLQDAMRANPDGVGVSSQRSRVIVGLDKVRMSPDDIAKRRVEREPCAKCGTRQDMHKEYGCKEWRA